MKNWETLPKFIERAKNHLSHLGDTDLFPNPYELSFLHSHSEETSDLVIKLHESLNNQTYPHPPGIVQEWFPVQEAGFRLGSQIDLVWNIYFTALTMMASDKIESSRISVNNGKVFSYRVSQNSDEIKWFNPELGWSAFNSRILELCNTFRYVAITDISDFYHRIRYDQIERMLSYCSIESHLANRLFDLLKYFNIKALGLPIGGSAARILAELSLVEFDHALHDRHVEYCRFVDDIRIFGNSHEEVWSKIAYTGQLLNAQGLTLQKNKTRILNTELLARELKALWFLNAKDIDENNQSIQNPRNLLLIPSFDPYSELQVHRSKRLEDFATTQSIPDFIKKEFKKIKSNLTALKNAISALDFSNEEDYEKAIVMLLSPQQESQFLHFLPKIVQSIKKNIGRLSEYAQKNIQLHIENKLTSTHYIDALPAMHAQLMQVLQYFPSPNNAEYLHVMMNHFRNSSSTILKREIMLLWGKWNISKPLNDIDPNLLNTYEKSAYLIACNMLSDSKNINMHLESFEKGLGIDIGRLSFNCLYKHNIDSN